MNKNSICHSRRHCSSTKPKTNKICSGGHQNFLILCPRCGWHNAYCLWCISNRTGKTNHEDAEKFKTVPQLCSFEQWCSTQIPCQQYGLDHPQQCFILKWMQSMKQGGKALLLIYQYHVFPKLWSSTNTVQVIKAVMSLAAEAELGALFMNAKQAALMHQMLVKLRNLQLPTSIQTDNLMAYGLVANKIIPKAMKAIYIRFHWLQDCEQQQQFRIYWWPRKMIYADYWTKHYATTHHKYMWAIFLQPIMNSSTTQTGHGGEWWHCQQITQTGDGVEWWHHQCQGLKPEQLPGLLGFQHSLTQTVGNGQIIQGKI